MKNIKCKVHAFAAFASFLFIASFWTCTVVSELFMSHSAVASVKQAIAYTLIIFVPAMAAAGATGFALAGKSQHQLLIAKRRRMPIIAMNGLLILVPVALFLNFKAQADAFDTVFYTVQVLELLVGAINLTLIGLNIRDGMALFRKKRELLVV